MCMNCAFYDTSMTFGTNVEHMITNIFGSRAISDFALQIRNGNSWRVFSKMAAVNLFSHILTTASSKSVVLVSKIGLRRPYIQIIL